MTPALRRVWLPWLLLLVPTLLIGAVALRLLWLEQRRIDLAAGEVRQRAEAATRARAQVAADNIELLVSEIRDGLLRELAEAPDSDLEALLANWPQTNPLVAETFLWRPDRAALAWPPADTAERRSFRQRHAALFGAGERSLVDAVRQEQAANKLQFAALEPPALARQDLAQAQVFTGASESAGNQAAVRPAPTTNKPALADQDLVTPSPAGQFGSDSFVYNREVAANQAVRLDVQKVTRSSAFEAKNMVGPETDALGDLKSPRKGAEPKRKAPAEAAYRNRELAMQSAAEGKRQAEATSPSGGLVFEAKESAQMAGRAESAKKAEAAPSREAAVERLRGAEQARAQSVAADVQVRMAEERAREAGKLAAPSVEAGRAERTTAASLGRAASSSWQEEMELGAKDLVFSAPAPAAVQPAAASDVQRRNGNGHPGPLVMDAAAVPWSEPASGWLGRTVEGAVYFLGWWQPAGAGAVRGVELNLPAVLERVQALVPVATADGERFAVRGPGEALDGVSIRIPLATTLPGWTLVAWSRAPGDYASLDSGGGFFVVAALLVGAFAASILAGGVMFFRQAAAAAHEAALKTSFVSNVSHEMKTPLTTIRMYAEMLADERVADPARRQRYFATIGRETTRLTRLVNNALDFGRLEAGRKEYRPEAIELGPWLSRLAEVHGPRVAEVGLQLTVTPPAEGAVVRCDPDSLDQMVLNLVDNAVKYAAAGGAVELRVEPVEGGWALVVADRGPGVPATHRERIFERFHRVEEALTAKVQGAGLGLTIARRLARDQRGNLVCRAREGGGTEFVLTLPAAT